MDDITLFGSITMLCEIDNFLEYFIILTISEEYYVEYGQSHRTMLWRCLLCFYRLEMSLDNL